MQIQIREAELRDATGIFDVKEAIRLPADADGSEQQGGFLLGTDLAQYEYFIEHDEVLVAENVEAKKIVGFAIVLKHESVRGSVLWQRAQEVRWEPEFEKGFDNARVSFFEQLGFLPDSAYRVYAKYIAFASVQRAFETHEHLFTTIVREPFFNRAALAFMRVVGFESVGVHDEVYPGYGRIVSEVFHLGRARFEEKKREGKFVSLVEKMRECQVLAG